MRIAYFHCFAGISGDMILGALVDVGLPLTVLERELQKLHLPYWRLQQERVQKQGLMGTKVYVLVEEEQQHRHLCDILALIAASDLSDAVKDLGRKIFLRLGQAEAKIHGVELDEVHFHEVGALDAIVDIMGAAIGLDYLNIDACYASEVHVGTGVVHCAHGLLPVPAPATMALLTGVPIYAGAVEGELVTPTGAAILTTLVSEYGILPTMQVEASGYGAGEKDFSVPNLLRLTIGCQEQRASAEDEVLLLETNIDDMNPQIYEYVMERCLTVGALDVSISPLLMKKNRPGNLLRVLLPREKQQEITTLLFQETTTLGLRILPVERQVLARELIVLETKYGQIVAKIGRLQGQVVNAVPEYADCQKAANQHQVPLKKVMAEANRLLQEREDRWIKKN